MNYKMEPEALQKLLLTGLDNNILLAQSMIRRKNVDQNEFGRRIGMMNELISKMSYVEFPAQQIESYQEKVLQLQKSHEEMRSEVGKNLFSILDVLMGMKNKLETMKEDEMKTALHEDAKMLKIETSKLSSGIDW